MERDALITIRLMGGMGNQLFQYAMGRSLAHDRNDTLFLDASCLGLKPFNPTLRKNELYNFNVKSQEVNFKPISFLKTRLTDKLTQKFPGINNYHHTQYIYEPTLKIHPNIIPEQNCDLYLIGYWQCEKYFLHNKDIIRRDLQIIAPQSAINSKWGEKISNTTSSVCLHVRRSDYLGLGWEIGIDYYQRAIDYLSERIDKPVFFIFSDDIKWAQNNLHIPHSTYYMNQNTVDSAYEDLRLMSLCKYFIIANSSFSWWAAWLGNFSAKVVITPSDWFEEPLPEGWIKM